MLKRRCPFIGLCGDPETVVGFASMRNCCNRVENPHPVRLSYQNSHCFTFEHRQCPVLTAEQMTDLPPDIAAWSIKKRAAWIAGGLASLFVFVVLMIIFFGGWQPAGAIDQPPRVSPSPTETLAGISGSSTPTKLPPLPSPTAVPAATEAATASPTAISSPTAVPSSTAVSTPSLPTLTPTECGAPPGWGIYVVKAGDTLYSIASAQGITVAELQAANCLTSTIIHVGQELYVPNPDLEVPTATPMRTATWTPTTSSLPPSSTPTLIPTDTPPPPTDTPLPSDTPTATSLPPTDTPLPPTPTDTPVPPTLTDTAIPPSPTDTLSSLKTLEP